jgi:hypothetical protein
MLRRTWNAFLDAIETVVEFVDSLTGPGIQGNRTPPALRKPESRG